MEEKDSLDSILREKLKQGDAPVPETSWAAISEKMALGKKNKPTRIITLPLYWIAASFLAGILAGVSSFYVYNLKKDNESLQSLVYELKNREIASLHSKNKETLLHERNNKELQLESSFDGKSEKNEINRSDNHDELNPNNELNSNKYTISNMENSFPDIGLTSIENYTRKGKNKSKIFPLRNSEKRETAGDYSNEIANQTLNSNIKFNKDVISKAADLNSSYSNEEKSIVSEHIPNNSDNYKVSDRNSTLDLTNLDRNKEKETASIKEIVKENNKSFKMNAAKGALEQDTIASNKILSGPIKKLDSLKSIAEAPKSIDSEKEKDNRQKRDFKIFGLPVAAGIYLAPEVASRSVNFSSVSDPRIQEYKKEDKVKFGFSAGVSLELDLPKDFYIRTGLNYWNVGDKNTVTLNHVEYDTIPMVISKIDTVTSFLPVNGTTNNINDGKSNIPNTGSYTVVTSNSITEIRESFSQFSSTISNNYHYMGVPLIIGKKLGNQNISFGIFSGIITNVLMSPSSAVYYVYYDGDEPGKFVQSQRDLARLSLVYNGGIDMDFRINKSLTLTMAPNIKYSFTSIYKNENSVKQLPYSIGMQFGIKYQLGI